MVDAPLAVVLAGGFDAVEVGGFHVFLFELAVLLPAPGMVGARLFAAGGDVERADSFGERFVWCLDAALLKL